MIIFLVAGTTGLMILILLMLASEADTGRRIRPRQPRRPFDLAPQWHRTGPRPGHHRYAPVPDRDWVIA